MSDVCSLFIKRAEEAVSDWDGQDNGDLLKLLAEKFGIPLAQLVQEGQAEVDREALEYYQSVEPQS